MLVPMTTTMMPRKKKEDVTSFSDDDGVAKPQQRNAANARERGRMRVLSKAFSRLKTTLPWVPPDTKLSKLDTLRLASSYIAHLKTVLDQEEQAQGGGYIHPINLTWPFTFNGRTIGGGGNPMTIGTTAPASSISNQTSVGGDSNCSNISSFNNNNIINNNNNCNFYMDTLPDERKPRFEDSLISSHH